MKKTFLTLSLALLAFWNTPVLAQEGTTTQTNYFFAGKYIDAKTIEDGDLIVLQSINYGARENYEGFVKKENDGYFKVHREGLLDEPFNHINSHIDGNAVFKVHKNDDGTFSLEFASESGKYLISDDTKLTGSNDDRGRTKLSDNKDYSKFTLEWQKESNRWQIKGQNDKILNIWNKEVQLLSANTGSTSGSFNIIKVTDKNDNTFNAQGYFISNPEVDAPRKNRCMTVGENGKLITKPITDARDGKSVWFFESTANGQYQIKNKEGNYISQKTGNEKESSFTCSEEPKMSFTLTPSSYDKKHWHDCFLSMTIKRSDESSWYLNIKNNQESQYQVNEYNNAGDVSTHWITVPAVELKKASNSSSYALGTFCSPAVTKIPAGVSAYIATEKKGNNTTLTLVKITTDDADNFLPANTPVILRADNSGFYPLEPMESQTTVTIPEGKTNLLKGTGKDRIVTPSAGCYGLGKPEGKDAAAMCTYKGKTIAPFKAYLPKEEGSTVQYRSIEFDGEGGTTGIEDINSSIQDDPQAPIYTLQGIQVEKPLQKGIYIQNGKKFIVK